MIQLENLWKSFPTPQGRKLVAAGIDARLPGGVAIGLLGRNGAGKTTLLDLIGGRSLPDRGRVLTRGTVSWPVGFSGSFHGDMTGAQNVRFIARIYGFDSRDLLDFVADFAELGGHFHLPVRTYSSGMRARLAFGTSLGIPFDTYLVDEVMSVGDAAFRAKSRALFDRRMAQAGAIVVSHSTTELRRLCRMGAVLEAGQLTLFSEIDAAIARHEANMKLEMDAE